MLLYFGEKIMKGILQYPVEIISMTYKQFCEETGNNENPFINSQTPGFKIIRSDIENENIYWEPEEKILPFFKMDEDEYKFSITFNNFIENIKNYKPDDNDQIIEQYKTNNHSPTSLHKK